MPPFRYPIIPNAQRFVFKGIAITDSAIIVARIENVLTRIETAMTRQLSENARLKQVELAAIAALSDLDAMLGSDEIHDEPELRRVG